jgi:hypothetical protein
MFDFPSSPTEGATYASPGGPTYVYHAPAWTIDSSIGDGDKGDVIVTGGGAALTLDPTVITPAARTMLDDADVPAMRATLGAVEESPIDGSPYVRQDGAWVLVDIPEGGTGTVTIVNTGSFF